MKITAKRDPRETGLRKIGQGPRGYDIKIDGVTVARVFPQRKGWEFEWSGWKINLLKTEKVETQRILTPKGNSNGWPMTDEGLEEAKNVALGIVKKIYNE